MTRRGMTLLEVLLAAVLLALLLGALVPWVRLAGASAMARGDRAAWEAGARSLLRQIGQWVDAGDFVESAKLGARVARLDDGTIRLRTRTNLGSCRGPVEITIRHDAEAGIVRAEFRQDGALREERVLLHGVRSWDAKIETANRLLSIGIEGDGALLARGFRW